MANLFGEDDSHSPPATDDAKLGKPLPEILVMGVFGVGVLGYLGQFPGQHSRVVRIRQGEQAILIRSGLAGSRIRGRLCKQPQTAQYFSLVNILGLGSNHGISRVLQVLCVLTTLSSHDPSKELRDEAGVPRESEWSDACEQTSICPISVP